MRLRHHKPIALLTLFGLWLSAANIATAWDGCGHKTVAAIAFSQLKPATQKKVIAVYKKDPRHRNFIDSATWPDDIKQGNNNDLPIKAHLNKPWHYVDIPFDMESTHPDQINLELNNHGKVVDPAHESSANVVTAIRYYSAQLKLGKGDRTAKADALSWLIHLTGDVHQPLHCVTVLNTLPNYTPPTKGDLGGNGFAIHHPSNELHALWDDMFDEPTGGPHGEGRDDSADNAKVIAQELSGRIHPDAAALVKTDPADWALESYALRSFVYTTPALVANSTAQNPPHTITPAYLTEARADAEQRIVVAGARLAKLLESIYGK